MKCIAEGNPMPEMNWAIIEDGSLTTITSESGMKTLPNPRRALGIYEFPSLSFDQKKIFSYLY